MTRPFTALVILLFAMLVTACGGSTATSDPSASLIPPLAAGAHTSTAFQPPLTFSVPDGWELANDTPTYLQLRPAGSDVAGIHLFRNAVAASQDPACPSDPELGVGNTSSELVAWMRGLPGLVVSTPAMATVGGLPGVSVDIGIREDWTQSCPFANGNPTVPLFNSNGAGYHWIVVGNERLRLYLVDLPSGGTILIDVDAFDGTLFDSLIGAALPIVRSFEFAIQ